MSVRQLVVRVDTKQEDSRTYAMVIPAEGETEVYLVESNFSRILAYNCANENAMSVGLLADEIVL